MEYWSAESAGDRSGGQFATRKSRIEAEKCWSAVSAAQIKRKDSRFIDKSKSIGIKIRKISAHLFWFNWIRLAWSSRRKKLIAKCCWKTTILDQSSAQWSWMNSNPQPKICRYLSSSEVQATKNSTNPATRVLTTCKHLKVSSSTLIRRWVVMFRLAVACLCLNWAASRRISLTAYDTISNLFSSNLCHLSSHYWSNHLNNR